METTISLKSEIKTIFLSKKREYCTKINKDVSANEYLKYLLGLDNAKN